MRDDEQVPTGSQPLGRTAKDLGPRHLRSRVEERCGHEVEGLLGRPCGQVMADPGDRLGDSGLPSTVGTAFDRRCRDIDSGDMPPLSGQPDGVTALSAAELERGSAMVGTQRRDHLGGGGVRPSRPSLGTFGVQGLPVLLQRIIRWRCRALAPCRLLHVCLLYVCLLHLGVVRVSGVFVSLPG